jgi:hypothetical protein
MSSFTDELKADPANKKYRNTIAIVSEKTNLENIKNEVIGLHTARPSRELYKHKMDANKLDNAILRDLSARARMVELRTNLYVHLEIIDTALDAFRDHLLAKYGDEIKSRANNAEERNAFVRRLSSKGHDLRSQYKVLIQIIDKFIEDIDKAGYGLTNAKDLLRIMLERPGTTL